MEYEEAEKAPVPGSDVEFNEDGVHIREEDRGIMMYAVFDEKEQVSQEFGPLNDSECLVFAEAYKKARDKYKSQQ